MSGFAAGSEMDFCNATVDRLFCIYARAAVGRLGVRPVAGQIIGNYIYKCQLIILIYDVNQQKLVTHLRCSFNDSCRTICSTAAAD